jgi:hypothetical protein
MRVDVGAAGLVFYEFIELMKLMELRNYASSSVLVT